MPKRSDEKGKRLEFICKKRVHDAMLEELSIAWALTKKVWDGGGVHAELESVSDFCQRGIAREIMYRRGQREKS